MNKLILTNVGFLIVTRLKQIQVLTIIVHIALNTHHMAESIITIGKLLDHLLRNEHNF